MLAFAGRLDKLQGSSIEHRAACCNENVACLLLREDLDKLQVGDPSWRCSASCHQFGRKKCYMMLAPTPELDVGYDLPSTECTQSYSYDLAADWAAG
jgi:hypothetical protein